MKIKYWVGIIALTGLAVFVLKSPLAAGLSENDPSSSERSIAQPLLVSNDIKKSASDIETSQVSGLASCPQLTGYDKSSLDEQKFRFYIKFCTNVLLANENWSALDSTIAYLRENKMRTPSGLWQQSLFYAGIEEFLGNVKTDVGFSQAEESLQHWIAASSNPAAAHLSMSTLMLDKAWYYRGTGYASSVSDDNFRLFYEQISKTKKYLLEHESISKQDPEWFSQMLTITRVEENGDERKHREYFDKAVKQYPDYYPVYFTAAVFYLPKWKGSEESFDQFAKYAGGKLDSRHAKSIYSRIYWAEICSKCGDRDVGNWRAHWSDLEAGFDEVINENPDQWNINSYAHIACMAYEQEKTLLLMEKIRSPPMPEAWLGQFNYQYCADWSGFTKGANDVAK